MACLFGSRLTPRVRVTLLGRWPEQLERLRRDGLTVVELDGDHSHLQLRATNDPAEAREADLVLVLVKGPQTEAAAREAREALAPGGLVLTLQNGLGNLQKLAAVVGPENAALGITVQGANMVAPGIVAHAGAGPTHLAAEAATGDRVRAVAELFRDAGLETRVVEDSRVLLWSKLAVNAAINPLTAILRVPNGALLRIPAATELLVGAAREVAQVASAAGQGLPLAFSDPAARARSVASATEGNRSSMLQDLQRGAETEIDSICGAVVQAAAQWGVFAPVNEALWRRVRSLEGRPEPLAEPSPASDAMLVRLEALERAIGSGSSG